MQTIDLIFDSNFSIKQLGETNEKTNFNNYLCFVVFSFVWR